MADTATARRWSDDPWSAMTTGEAEAWRAGYAAAKAQAVAICAKVSDAAHPHADSDAHVAGDRIAAMEPPT